MPQDARFEDGGERPVNLMAETTDDLTVISALVQDAILPVTEMKYQSGARRFALFLNRFRWEDRPVAERSGRAFERVQSVLSVQDVLGVSSQGIDRADKDVILSLLSITFEAGEDGAGHVDLTFAGDGVIRLAVECLDVVLKDVTKPYVAPSGKVPTHRD